MSSDEDIGGESGKTLVAEYVLGLLDAPANERVRRQIEADPRLQREEAFWRSRFAALDSEFAEEMPPAHAGAAIEARIFGDEKPAGFWTDLWNSLPLWRGLAAGALAVAVVAAGVSLTRMAPQTPAELAVALVAALEEEGSDVRFLALYDPQQGMLRLTGLSGAPGTDEDFELWAIEEGAQPVSLGVVVAGGHSVVGLPAAASAGWGEGSVLAITLEPEGGSPTGQPTGPLMAQGVATPI
jgi:anti-sigma-K factor RskA